jgi:hypothetical protein
MSAGAEIRANFDRETIVVYQAYNPAIATAALAAGTFVPPFSFGRMTWIKPSFLWLMHRSNWGRKSGQERILAVRITRTAWERALELAVPTTFERSLYATGAEWREAFRRATVVLQWDPERSLRGASLPYRSIQIGLSRLIIGEYATQWITAIEDYTPRVWKMYDLLQRGEVDRAKRHLPPERIYPLGPELARRVLASSHGASRDGTRE